MQHKNDGEKKEIKHIMLVIMKNRYSIFILDLK